ncbi:MAG: hypothetical protein IPM31_13880 [Anaerolineae bacterium]|nr:hypothetical protein [Anaerolineae bacterium]MBL8107418.1 hypothetical protein [Anaerolineales bacterium]
MGTQQKRRSKNIIIWRDSVAAGDDIYPRHEKRIKMESGETVESMLEKILAIHYLPSIIDGKATWIVVGKNPLAVVAQQRSKPHYLVEPTALIENLIERKDGHHLEFMYWCQVEPQKVIASIKQGKPLPDKFGMDKKSKTSLVARIRKLFSTS